jgi:hypothetical protein
MRVFPPTLNVHDLQIVLARSLMAGECGDSLVSGDTIAPPPADIWAKQMHLVFNDYSIASVDDHSKGMLVMMVAGYVMVISIVKVVILLR